ncbi:MAG TPA: glycosyltransferase family 2 protein [Ktedonobacterales bacterium]|nr:glycosyltransferase family 2 protein [Ktedonobacterales bacterium]
MMTHQQKSAMPDTTDTTNATNATNVTDASDATTDAIETTPPAMPLTTRGISVVLPAHNEEAVLAATLDKCIATLSEIAPDYEIIVVDDGSSDRTGAIAGEYAAANPHIRVVHNRPQRGYGGALIAGFNAMTKSLAFFMDADGQFDIRDLAWLLPLREQGHRAVLGYRLHRQDSPLRKVNAWGWKLLVSTLFDLHVRDVDCAFKLYDTSLVRAVDVTAEGAMVNTEMLVKLTRMGVPFVEVPVRHYPRVHGQASGANLRVIVHAFGELFRLHSKLRTWHAEVPPEE